MERLLLFLPLVSSSCVLCPFRIPPRPRPLDQFQLPEIPKMNTETMPKFCNWTNDLPVGDECKTSIADLLCKGDELISAYSEGCPGSDQPDQCIQCQRVKSDSFWVIRWFDSLGKMPSGVSDGNYYWLGDYEICRDVTREGHFNGQYCRVRMEVPDALVETGCPQKDPLEITMGICAPLACDSGQLSAIVNKYAPYNVTVDCELPQTLSIPAQLLIFFIGVWLLVIAVCSILLKIGVGPRWIRSLAVQVNLRQTLSTRRHIDHNLHSVHGLEFFAFFGIIVGYVYNMMLPYIENVVFAFDNLSSPLAHLTNNSSYHTDALFALTAYFTTAMLYGNLKRKKDVLFALREAFLRFWPSYLFIIVFMTVLFNHIASGPMWIHGDTVSRCEQNWWKNILFINNIYFGTKETCVDFGYAVSLEAQFLIVLTLLVYLSKDYFFKIALLATLAVIASVFYTFFLIYSRKLPPSFMITAEPLNIQTMEQLLDGVVISPLTRMSPFLLGFLCRILTHDTKEKPTGILLLVIALSGLSIFFVAFFLFSFASGVPGTAVYLAIYGAFHRPMWSIAVLAVCWTCQNTGLTTLNGLLGWRLFSPVSKVIYMAIVLAEPIILFNFSSMHRPGYATHWSMIYASISTTCLSIILAFVVDVFLARPIRNLILGTKEHEPVETTDS